MVEEKAGVEKQNSEKGFEKNEHACIVEGVVGFRIFLPVKFKARLSSDRSERKRRNPGHAAGAHWHR